MKYPIGTLVKVTPVNVDQTLDVRFIGKTGRVSKYDQEDVFPDDPFHGIEFDTSTLQDVQFGGEFLNDEDWHKRLSEPTTIEYFWPEEITEI